MSAASSSNQTPTAFHRFAERLVFGNRPVVLILFALITAVLTFFASQLRVDAGFKKQIPLQHEYMKTFIDYEQEFGGANRVLIAVMDKSGDMFNLPFFQTMEKITQDAKAIDSVDEARVRSIFTPNVRFVEVVEDGFAGGNVIPADFTPNSEGFAASAEQFATIKANMEKASIVGRLVAKDFSGAMIWVDLVPENPEQGVKVDYNRIAEQLDQIRAKYENEHTTVAIIGFAKMVGDLVLRHHHRLHLVAAVHLLLFGEAGFIDGVLCAGIGSLDAGRAAPARLRHRSDEHADAIPDIRHCG